MVNKKPEPEPYLKAIDYLKVDKNKSIIFEDSEVGIISAKNSGCNYIHIKNYKEVNIHLIKNINI